MPANNILAKKIYKNLIPRVEEDLKITEVKIKDVMETIKKSKSTKARGNDNLKYVCSKTDSGVLGNLFNTYN